MFKPRIELRSIQRAAPAQARASARRLAFRALDPARRAGRVPSGLADLDQMLASHIRWGVPSHVDLLEETLPDGSLDWSPLRWPARTVRSVFVMLDLQGHTGWRFDLNHLISPDNQIVYEPNHRPLDTPAMLRRLHPNPRHVDGTIAYLSNTWPTNYTHWMMLTLPLVERYRAHLGDEPDYWYLGEAPTHWQIDSLEAAGVATDRLLHEPVTGTRMLSCAVGRYGRGVDRRSMTFARELFDIAPGPGTKLVFLGRGEATTRRFLNEQECFAAVAPLGFEFLSTAGMTLADEVRAFSDAAVILTCHGSASMNAAFAPAGSVLFELFPPELRSDSNHMFAELAAACGGRHLALAGRPVSPGRKQIDADLDMDPELLRSTAARLVDELGGG